MICFILIFSNKAGKKLKKKNFRGRWILAVNIYQKSKTVIKTTALDLWLQWICSKLFTLRHLICAASSRTSTPKVWGLWSMPLITCTHRTGAPSPSPSQGLSEILIDNSFGIYAVLNSSKLCGITHSTFMGAVNHRGLHHKSIFPIDSGSAARQRRVNATLLSYLSFCACVRPDEKVNFSVCVYTHRWVEAAYSYWPGGIIHSWVNSQSRSDNFLTCRRTFFFHPPPKKTPRAVEVKVHKINFWQILRNMFTGFLPGCHSSPWGCRWLW